MFFRQVSNTENKTKDKTSPFPCLRRQRNSLSYVTTLGNVAKICSILLIIIPPHRSSLAMKDYAIADVPDQDLNNKLQNIQRLIAKGKGPAALTQIDKFLKHYPDNKYAKMLKGLVSKKEEEIVQALRICDALIKQNPDDTFARLSYCQLFERNGHTGEAINECELYIKSWPDDPAGYTQLAEISRAHEDWVRYFISLTNLAGLQELNTQQTNDIKQLAPIVTLRNFSPNLIRGFTALIKDKRFTPYDFSRSAKNLLIERYNLNQENVEVDFWAMANDEILLNIVSLIRIDNKEIEELLTGLRLAILDIAVQGHSFPVELAQAIAYQCYYNDYVFHISEAEEQAINKLATLLSKACEGISWKPEDNENELLLLSMYSLLHDFEGSSLLLKHELKIWPMRLRELAKLSLFDIDSEIQTSKNIPTLSDIENDTSVSVQEHYEKNPYPRWSSLQAKGKFSVAEFLLNNCPEAKKYIPKRYYKNDINILIAGCGTGRQPIIHALNYPKVKITAIDLSRRSLAYAKLKAEQLKLNNIVFYQADILNLPDDFGPFDYIECSGVLHHMADPVAGSQALLKYLRPGSLMNIGLYSKSARIEITQTQNDIREKRLGTDAKTIRDYRHQFMQEHPESPLLKFKDFYNLSECRDLIFHQHEQCFTWERIESALQVLDLELCGLWDNGGIRNKFHERFSKAYDTSDFNKLKILEENFPNIFSSMYQFICYKRS